MDLLPLDLINTAQASEGVPTTPDTFLGQLVGGIVWAIAMASMGCYGLYRLISERKRAERFPAEEKLTVGAVELTDTSLLRKDIAELSLALRSVTQTGAARDEVLSDMNHKIDAMMQQMQKLENRAEVEKMAREEVARQLAQRRS